MYNKRQPFNERTKTMVLEVKPNDQDETMNECECCTKKCKGAMCAECTHNWNLHEEAKLLAGKEHQEFVQSHALKDCNGNNCNHWYISE